MQIKLGIDEIIKLLQDMKASGNPSIVNVWSDAKWEYPLDLPSERRNEGNCPMLHIMFQIERKAGIVIHIPYITLDAASNIKNEGEQSQ